MLPHRGRRGTQTYASGMDASAPDKAKLLKFVRRGVIAELGCGAGTILGLLRQKFPKSHLIGLDLSDEMIAWCRRRFPGVEIRRHDITRRIFDEGSIDTIFACSVFHEVFSYNGYDAGPVRDALRQAAAALRKGGRLIVRDGVKPARSDEVFVSFLNDETRLKFIRFSQEFGPGPVRWKEIEGRIQVSRWETMEFLSKYIYDVNWSHEVKEQFGVFTLDQWRSELGRAGLKGVHRESYLIPWLRKTHWERDVLLSVRTEQGYRPTDFPHSTMILVGEK